jgi:hypothetical protein
MLAAYSAGRKHWTRLVKELSTMLIAMTAGTADAHLRETPSVPSTQREQSQSDSEPDPVRPARHWARRRRPGRKNPSGLGLRD